VQYNLGSSIMAYEFEPRTKESILAEKQEEEIKQNFDTTNRYGVKSHLFFGHGPTSKDFEKRDLGTTNDCVYNQKQKVDTIIDPHIHTIDVTKRHKYQCNAKAEDLPTVFGASSNPIKAKPYSDATKSFDANWNKTGLRQ
jgi:hypothetical protein